MVPRSARARSRRPRRAARAAQVMDRRAVRYHAGGHDPDRGEAGRPARRTSARPGRGLVRGVRGRADGPRRRPGGGDVRRPRASGATWSRSPGTSRPSRTPTASPTCCEHTLERDRPERLPHTEPADEADGVVTAWFEFETAVGRGTRAAAADRGGRRLQGLDLPHHAPRAQGPRGAARHQRRPMGAEHGVDKDRLTWKEKRAGRGRVAGLDRAALRAGGRRRPGRHRARRAAAPARRARAGHRQAPAARRPVAQPLQVALPARPGLVRPPALPEVPGQLAGLRAQGQDRRLARVVREGHGGRRTGPARRRTSARRIARRRASGPSRSSARASRSRCGRSSSCWRPACRASRTCPTIPGQDVFRGRPAPLLARTPGRTRTPARRCVVIGSRTTRAFDICGAL